MKNFLRRVTVLLMLFTFWTGFWNGAQAEEVHKISMNELESLIKETGDKVVLLNFFASWCGPCRMEIPDLMKLRKRYSPDQVVLLGISVDQSAADLQAFLAKTNFNYPVYQAQSDIVGTLRISSIPRTLLLDQRGELVLDEIGVLPWNALVKTLDALLQRQ